jgi:hypothetical protein
VLWLAAQIDSTCAAAYRSASEKARNLFNNAVFEAVLVRDGQVADALYRSPLNVLFVRSGSDTEIWLGRRDSSLRLAEPALGVLPRTCRSRDFEFKRIA